MSHESDASSECPQCGLLQALPPTRDGALVTCVRCNALLRQVRRYGVELSTACAVLGLSLLACANVFPLASVSIAGGKFVTTNVADSVSRLGETGGWELIPAVALTLLVFPALRMLLVVGMAVAVRCGHAPHWLKRGFSELPRLGSWSMVDVFLLGAMVALFRMRSQGHVSFEPAIFALGGHALCALAMDAGMDRREFWRRLPPAQAPVWEEAPAPGALGTRIACVHCRLVDAGREGRKCPRCEHTLKLRKPDSILRTWAFVAAGFLLLIPANVWPVMTVVKLGRGGPSTIWHGVLELMDRELYGLACIVFLASILVPVAKLLALSVLLVMTQRGSAAGLEARSRIYRVVAVVGRWSMIDIFSTAILVALARWGVLIQVLPERGALAFCGVVVVTMIAAEQFDPRLMWDAAGRNAPDASTLRLDAAHSSEASA